MDSMSCSSLVCLLQLPVDYSTLKETARYRVEWGEELHGLCYLNSRLYVVEVRESSYSLTTSHRLCMYGVAGDKLTLMCTRKLEGLGCLPRVDAGSNRLYIPRGQSGGVSAVSCGDSSTLLTHPTLTCVGRCWSVGVLSPRTLFVCDEDRGCVNSVTADNTVNRPLKKPTEVGNQRAQKLAALESAVLVWYGDRNLVVYEDGVFSPGTMVTWPEGLGKVSDMSSDGVSRFLLCDGDSKCVFILDVSGKLCDRIHIDTDSWVYDCTVGDGKLWVGCDNGDVIVMSSP